MKQRLVKMLSVLLCICMLATMFTGCNENTEAYTAGSATPASYHAAGRFTSTLTVSSGSFPADISKDSIAVSYYLFDEAAYQKAFQEESRPGQRRPTPADHAVQVNATVESVTRKDERTLEVIFTDRSAAENLPAYYTITVDGKAVSAKEPVYANVQVLYPENKVISDIPQIDPRANRFTATLQVENGTFAETVDATNVTLQGAFADMVLEKAEKTEDGLRITAVGTPQYDTYAGVYPAGEITLAKEAFADGWKDSTCVVSVAAPQIYLDVSQFSFDGSQLSMPVTLVGTSFSSGASVEEIAFDGVPGAQVTGFQKTDGQNAVLSVKLDAAAIDDAVALLKDGTVSVQGSALTTGETVSSSTQVSGASFSTIFDYIEDKDGMHVYTLELVAQNGVFNPLTADQVSFSDGFEGATNVTLNGTTLTFSIYPFAKEEKAEDLVLLGTVKLAAGAMKNAWGTDSGELAFSRSYAPSNIGKAISLDTIKEIYEASSGYIDTATSVIGGISSVVEIGVTISELMGWKENTDSILDDVRGELQELDSKVTELAEYIRAQASNANFEKEKAKVDNIKTMLNYLLAQNEIFFNLVANYTIQIALENGQVEVYDRNGKPTGEFLPIHSEYTEGILKLEYAIDAKCVEIRFESTGDRFTKTKKATHYIGKPQFMEKLAKLNSPAVMDALAQQAMKLAAEQMKDDLVNGSSFDSYLSTLCKEIMDKDILAHYNTMLSYMYNFETQAQTDKMGFIAYLSDICTMSVIMTSCILDAQNPNNPTAVLTRVDTMNKNMQNLKAYLAKYKVTERPDGSIFMYVYGEAGGYVKNVICQLPLTRYHDFDGFAFLSDTQIKDFMRRLNGRSVQEELKNAGFTMESFTRSFDYYDKLSCMDNWAYSKPYTETKGDGFFTKDKNYTYAKTLPCTSKDPESVTVEICYDSSLFWTLFTDGVYENIVALYWLEKAG